MQWISGFATGFILGALLILFAMAFGDITPKEAGFIEQCQTVNAELQFYDEFTIQCTNGASFSLSEM